MAGRNTQPFRDIGRRLAAVRQDHGLTQKSLAERLGRPPSYVAKLELAERRLDVVDLVEVAQALSIEPKMLLSLLIPAAGQGLGDQP